jgi:hypothetical protein
MGKPPIELLENSMQNEVPLHVKTCVLWGDMILCAVEMFKL